MFSGHAPFVYAQIFKLCRYSICRPSQHICGGRLGQPGPYKLSFLHLVTTLSSQGNRGNLDVSATRQLCPLCVQCECSRAHHQFERASAEEPGFERSQWLLEPIAFIEANDYIKVRRLCCHPEVGGTHFVLKQ